MVYIFYVITLIFAFDNSQQHRIMSLATLIYSRTPIQHPFSFPNLFNKLSD